MKRVHKCHWKLLKHITNMECRNNEMNVFPRLYQLTDWLVLTCTTTFLKIIFTANRSSETLSEEWFVDKSRNIGVTDGGKDLKLQVKKKKLKRNLRTHGTQPDYKSLCKISKRLMKLEDYKNSLNYLNMVWVFYLIRNIKN